MPIIPQKPESSGRFETVHLQQKNSVLDADSADLISIAHEGEKNAKNRPNFVIKSPSLAHVPPRTRTRALCARALGNTTSIASAPLKNDLAIATAFARRVERYILQSAIAGLLPQERVSGCRRHVVKGKDTVDLMFSPSHESAYLLNLLTCGSVWHCPICATRITEQRRIELSAAIKASDLTPYLLTFTMRHKFTDRLIKTLDALIGGYRNFKSGRRYKAIAKKFGWVGSIRALETTYGDNGWHPHLHVLAFLKKPLDKAQLEEFTAEIRFRWLYVLEGLERDASWERGVDVRSTFNDVAEYVAKFNREPIHTGWGLEAELTKAPVKRAHPEGRTPFQLAADALAGDELAERLFVEYATTFKGRNQLVWSRGLRELLGLGVEKTDAELAAEEVDPIDVLLARLTLPAWRHILKHERRAHFIEAGISGDKERVEAFLKSMGMKQETDEKGAKNE